MTPVMVKMLVTHFATTVAHQMLALVINIRGHDFSALADWAPKLTVSTHVHQCIYIVCAVGSVIYVRVLRPPFICDHNLEHQYSLLH